MADIERKEQEVPKYVKVREVMQLCEVSESRAYRIMQQLNKEGAGSPGLCYHLGPGVPEIPHGEALHLAERS